MCGVVGDVVDHHEERGTARDEKRNLPAAKNEKERKNDEPEDEAIQGRDAYDAFVFGMIVMDEMDVFDELLQVAVLWNPVQDEAVQEVFEKRPCDQP